MLFLFSGRKGPISGVLRNSVGRAVLPIRPTVNRQLNRRESVRHIGRIACFSSRQRWRPAQRRVGAEARGKPAGSSRRPRSKSFPRRGRRHDRQGSGDRRDLRDQNTAVRTRHLRRPPSCGCTVASFDKLISRWRRQGGLQRGNQTFSARSPSRSSWSPTTRPPQMNLFVKANVKPFVDVLPALRPVSVIKGMARART